MDGFHGNPDLNGWFGGFSHIFGNTHTSFMIIACQKSTPLLPGLSRWIKSTLVAKLTSNVVVISSCELSSPLCSFPWRDHCPKQCLLQSGHGQKSAQQMVILTFGDGQKRFNEPMNSFLKPHMLFLGGRKLAELATMEFFRDLGRERFAGIAASHNCPKVDGYDRLNGCNIIEVDVMLPSSSESSVCIHRRGCVANKFACRGPHEASPSCENSLNSVGKSLNQSVMVRWNPCQTNRCLGHLHRLHLLGVDRSFPTNKWFFHTVRVDEG